MEAAPVYWLGSAEATYNGRKVVAVFEKAEYRRPGAAAWLPLGLPESDPFWAGAAQPWTSKKIWAGEAATPDHALTDTGHS